MHICQSTQQCTLSQLFCTCVCCHSCCLTHVNLKALQVMATNRITFVNEIVKVVFKGITVE